MKCSVRSSDRFGRTINSFNLHHLECKIIYSGVERARKEAQDYEGATPYSPSWSSGADHVGYAEHRRPEEYVSGKEATVRGCDQWWVVVICGKLLRKEEVKLNPKENPGEEKQRANNQGRSSEPATGKSTRVKPCKSLLHTPLLPGTLVERVRRGVG